MWSRLENVSAEKLKMLGIEVIESFDNGVKIVKKVGNHGYRLLGISDELLKKEFVSIMKMYGMIELSISEAETDYRGVWIAEKRIVLNKHGEILLDEITETNTKKTTPYTVYHEKLIKEIINHGVDYDIFKQTCKINDRFIGDLVSVTEMCSGRYQLAKIDATKEDICSYVLFDKSANKMIAYGLSVPFIKVSYSEIQSMELIDELSEAIITLNMNRRNAMRKDKITCNEEIIALSMNEGTYTTYRLNRKQQEELKKEKENTIINAYHNILVKNKDEIIRDLHKEVENLPLTRRYNPYNVLKLRKCGYIPTEKLEELGIKVTQLGKVRAISTYEGIVYWLATYTPTGLCDNKNRLDLMFGILIVDGLHGESKEILEKKEYKRIHKHGYGLLELIGEEGFENALVTENGDILIDTFNNGNPEETAREAIHKVIDNIIKTGIDKNGQENKEKQIVYPDSLENTAYHDMILKIIEINEYETQEYKIISVGSHASTGYKKISLAVFNKKNNKFFRLIEETDRNELTDLMNELAKEDNR